jgi:hypothetical protein
MEVAKGLLVARTPVIAIIQVPHRSWVISFWIAVYQADP